MVLSITISLFLGTAVPPGIAQDLPLQDSEFHGYIDKVNNTYPNSHADNSILLPPGEPPEGAPNVVLIMLDDVGFGASETFGGPVHTPTLNELAENGLSYRRFHTTSLCAPTRAGLLTGRNHHSAATGVVPELSTGFPGYTGLIPQSTATVAKILQTHGYNTGWVGKNHNLPADQSSKVGPFSRWPNELGFDYFYGFSGGGGETDQWYPALYENRSPINQPSYPNKDDPDKGYNLTHDLADNAISWVRYQKSLSPDTPFFLYFAPGATHAPHQPPPSYTEKYAGKFTDGWDELQKNICAKQKKMGIIPENSECTDKPREIPDWDNNDKFDDEFRDLMAKQMQTYAGFLEYTDVEVGRVIDAIDDLGEKDNTLIIYIVGDNGASAEGSFYGGCYLSGTYTGVETREQKLSCKEKWGNPGTTPHYAVGWAWATDAPFRWTKQVPSYFGGTRNPMVISWPKFIKAKKPDYPYNSTDVKDARTANLRDQFLHVIDVAPTILDAVGIDAPEYVNGIEQKPMEGASFANTFGSDGAEAIPLRDTQYFELLGHRGIYHDGWMASTFHEVRLPWETTAPSTLECDSGCEPELDDPWELFNLEEDFTQYYDVSAEHQEKLKEMVSLFDREAEKYNVYPMDDRFGDRQMLERPSVFGDRTYFEFYPGAIFLPGDVAPNVTENDAYIITADLKITDPENVKGVIFASGGGDGGGYSLYVNEEQNLVFEYKNFDQNTISIASGETLPTLASDETSEEIQTQVKFVFIFKDNEEPGAIRSGTGYLSVNGNEVASDDIDEVYIGDFAMDSQDVGMDLRAPVSDDYEPPFEFTGGVIKKVTLNIDPSDEEMASLEQPDSSEDS